jgi:dihydrolipoamide dehydrogenase
LATCPAIRDPAIRDDAKQAFNEEFYLDAAAQVQSVNEFATGAEVRYLHRDGAWRT